MDDGMGTRGKTWMMAWGPPKENATILVHVCRKLIAALYSTLHL